MAVSLGTRVSGLLVAGSVAVLAVAFTDGGRNAGVRPGEGHVPVIAGPSSGAEAGGTVAPPAAPPGPPPLLSSPAGGSRGAATTPPPGEHSPRTAPDPAPSATDSDTDTDTAQPVRLRWLPPGPGSPDADGVPDPASVYDVLTDPARCAAGLAAVPETSDDPEWQVLRGLASACLAAQGRGGDWDTARLARDAAAGVGSCKGRAALAVLDGLLEFERLRPAQTARLGAKSQGPAQTRAACDFGIAAVDAGDAGGGVVRAGERVVITLRGVFFDVRELALGGEVLVGGRAVTPAPEGVAPGVAAGVPVGSVGSTVSVVVPEMEGYPRVVGVSVRYGGGEAVVEGVLSVVGGGPGASPGPSPGSSPGSGTGSLPGSLPGASPLGGGPEGAVAGMEAADVTVGADVARVVVEGSPGWGMPGAEVVYGGARAGVAVSPEPEPEPEPAPVAEPVAAAEPGAVVVAGGSGGP
ncbi:hypothetical protein ACFRI7_30835 [Streptomyces sp. NPDC056716]|uniref:hypothetical protein n=1 Tax=unclassified Streptomyces TaxID=2593676 RepID=UPI003680AE0C